MIEAIVNASIKFMNKNAPQNPELTTNNPPIFYIGLFESKTITFA